MKTGVECLKLLFICGLLSKIAKARIYTTDNCTSDPSEYLLPAVTQCQHYDIKLITTTALNREEHFWLEMTYFIEIKNTTNNIRLHYNFQSQIDEAGTKLRFLNQTYPIYYPIRYIYCSVTEVLAIYFPTALRPANYILNMIIIGRFTADNVEGFSKITHLEEDGSEKTFLSTNFLWNARNVFPCWDEPTSRATFNISVKHPHNFTILSNMPKLKEEDEGGMMWTHFYKTPPIPTYLVVIVMFNYFTYISENIKSISIWSRPEIIQRLNLTHNIALLCSNYIAIRMNLPERIPKVDHIAVPSPQLLTKSNWGLHTYKELDLYDDLISKHRQNFTAHRVAKILVHHWFRSIINPTWWNHTWLSDGFATFLGLYISNQVFGQSRTMDRFVVEEQHLVMSQDILSRVYPITRKVETLEDINKFFYYYYDEDGLIQKKAAAIVRMMYHLMPNDIFWNAIRVYLQEHKFRSATPSDLWRAFQKAFNESDFNFRSSDKIVGIDTVMANWFSASNYPVLKVESTEEFGLLAHGMRISQMRPYVQKRDSPYLWWLPVTYTTDVELNFNNTSPRLWIHPLDGFVFINNVRYRWMIFNLQQSGYYRVNYNEENWRRITIYLETSNRTKIHPINRAQLISDSYFLMLAGQLLSTVFLDLTNYLKHERDYIPWYPMKLILSNLTIFFQYQESFMIKEHLLEIIDEVTDDVGFEENIHDSDFKDLFHLLVLDLACQLQQTTCLVVAKSKLISTYRETGGIAITPSWEKWTICHGLTYANNATWSLVLNVYNSTRNFKYLEYLTCAENTAIIIDYIRKMMLNYIEVGKLTTRLKIINIILKKHASKNLVLDYVLMNYHQIKNFVRFPIINILITSVYRVEHFEKLKNFVTRHTFEEEFNHWNFKENLISRITKQLNNVRAEVMMFSKVFRITVRSF